MSSYIHCRSCGTVKTSSTQHYISNCKHVFCKPCLGKSGPKCVTCCKPAKFIEINNKMPHNVRTLFEPIALKFRTVQEAAEFQFEQVLHFTKPRLPVIQQYENLKHEIIQIKKMDDKVLDDYNQEVALIRKLKKAIGDMKANRDTSPTFNSTVMNSSANSSLDGSLGNLSQSFKSASLGSNTSYESSWNRAFDESHDSGLGFEEHCNRRSSVQVI